MIYVYFVFLVSYGGMKIDYVIIIRLRDILLNIGLYCDDFNCFFMIFSSFLCSLVARLLIFCVIYY